MKIKKTLIHIGILLIIIGWLLFLTSCSGGGDSPKRSFDVGDKVTHKLTGDTLLVVDQGFVPEIYFVRNSQYESIKVREKELSKID